jgi:hypothetical protein
MRSTLRPASAIETKTISVATGPSTTVAAFVRRPLAALASSHRLPPAGMVGRRLRDLPDGAAVPRSSRIVLRVGGLRLR